VSLDDVVGYRELLLKSKKDVAHPPSIAYYTYFIDYCQQYKTYKKEKDMNPLSNKIQKSKHPIKSVEKEVFKPFIHKKAKQLFLISI